MKPISLGLLEFIYYLILSIYFTIVIYIFFRYFFAVARLERNGLLLLYDTASVGRRV